MSTAKDEVRKLLERLPNDASFEDIQYQVYLLDEIARGSEEIERGEGIELEEARVGSRNGSSNPGSAHLDPGRANRRSRVARASSPASHFLAEARAVLASFAFGPRGFLAGLCARPGILFFGERFVTHPVRRCVLFGHRLSTHRDGDSLLLPYEVKP